MLFGQRCSRSKDRSKRARLKAVAEKHKIDYATSDDHETSGRESSQARREVGSDVVVTEHAESHQIPPITPKSALSKKASEQGTYHKHTKHVRFATETHAVLPLEKGIDFTSTFTLIAGEGHSASFTVHQNLLACSSPFFQQLLQPSNAESTATDDNDTVVLPGIRPKGINIFLHWLYKSDLRETYSIASSPASLIKHLGEAHALGQLADIAAFRDYCVDETIFLLGSGHLNSVNKMLADHVYPAAGQTPLAKLCVNFVAWEGDKDAMGYSYSVYQNEKLRHDIEDALRVKKARLAVDGDARPPYVEDASMYHELGGCKAG